jgi:hypothetical protein
LDRSRDADYYHRMSTEVDKERRIMLRLSIA